MKHSLEYQQKFENLNIAIRVTFYLSLLALFFGGTFIKNSQIYANVQEQRTESVTLPYFDTSIIERELSPKSVTIKDSISSTSYLVYSKYAKDIVKEVDFPLGIDDEILPDSNDSIPNNGVIVVIKVDILSYSKLRSVPFKIKEIETETMERGINKIITNGVSGVVNETFREVYKDEALFKKEITRTEIVINMVPQVVLIGVKPVTVHSCNYWNKVVEDEVPREKFPKKNAWMRYIMYCETGCDSGQITSNKFYGLYQFSKSTYKAYGGTNIFDGYEQIEVVSRMYDLEGNPAHHWPACNRAFERDYN